MKRTIMKVAMGQKREMEIVRIESDVSPGPESGNDGFRSFWFFVESLHTNPTLLRHSVECPDGLIITYSGGCWVAETRAVVDVKEG